MFLVGMAMLMVFGGRKIDQLAEEHARNELAAEMDDMDYGVAMASGNPYLIDIASRRKK